MSRVCEHHGICVLPWLHAGPHSDCVISAQSEQLTDAETQVAKRYRAAKFDAQGKIEAPAPLYPSVRFVDGRLRSTLPTENT